MRQMIIFIVCSSFSIGCASTPGANPHDMSTAQHEEMAKHEDQLAHEHAQRYDPNDVVVRCRKGKNDPEEVCWESVTNPSAEHLRQAEEHHKRAADHRAASEALRNAEAQACTGISEENRDMSPFDHREDITKVEELKATSGKTPPQLQGAVISFRAVPGMTVQWLQHVVDCHIARNAALGHDVPEMPNCPLVLKGVTASVSATDGGFAVTVRSDDPDTARAVLVRAQSLGQH